MGPPSTQLGRYALPNHNGGNLQPTTVCDTCRRTGNVAGNCNILAIAIFIDKYKQDLPDDMEDRIEADWITRWRSAVGNLNRKPHQVMTAYLDLLDMTVDELDDQMCWDCWPDENSADVNETTA